MFFKTFFFLILSIGFGFSQDSYEADNDTASATIILANDTSASHSIHTGSDEDWFSFTLTEETLVILESFGSSGDNYMRLYSNNGALITGDDDSGISTFASISRSLTAGKYFVQITDLGQNNAIANYSFAFLIINDDNKENNNSLNNATPLSANDTLKSLTLLSTDPDWFKITVPSHSILHFTMDKQSDFKSSYLYLFDADSNLIVNTTSSYDVSITRSLPSGIYYVQLQNSSPSYVHKEYNVYYTLSSISDDSKEENDNLSSATPLTVNDTLKSLHLLGSDADWFKITLSSTSQVVFFVDKSATNTQSNLRLYNSDSNLITSTLSSNDQALSRILTQGTYYYQLYNSSKNDINQNYSVYYSATAIPDDKYEENDNLIQATTLTANDTLDSLDLIGDNEDWFKINVTKSAIVEFSVDKSSGYSAYGISIFDSDSNLITQASSASDYTLSKFLSPGTYYYRILHSSPTSISNNYSVYYNTTYHDDDSYESNDNLSTATPIAINDTLDSLRLLFDNQDWFKFSIAQKGLVTLKMTKHQDINYSYLRVFDKDSVRIDFSNGYNTVQLSKIFEVGTYYVQLNNLNNIEKNRNYSLSCLVDYNINDRFENNDSLSLATTLNLGDTLDSLSIPTTDIDWFNIPTSKAKTIQIDIEGGSSKKATLYDPFGQTAYKTTSGTTISFKYDLPGSGTFKLKIEALTPSSFIKRYSISTTDLSSLDDAYEPDNSKETATNLQINSTSKNHALVYDNEDWFTFQVPSTQTLSLFTEGDANGNTKMFLYKNGSSSYLHYDYDSGFENYSSITKTLSSGIYYVKIQNKSTDSLLKNYSFKIQESATTIHFVSANAKEGGQITPVGISGISTNEKLIFKAIPNKGFRFYRFSINGNYYSNNSQYTLHDNGNDQKITAYFKAETPYLVSLQTQGSGTLNINHNDTIYSGETRIVKIQPAKGYYIKSVRLNSTTLGTSSTIILSNVKTNQALFVVFEKGASPEKETSLHPLNSSFKSSISAKELTLFLSQSQTLQLTIFDLNGRGVFHQKLNLQEGEHLLNLPQSLPNGQFIVTIEGSNHSKSLLFDNK